MSGITPLMERNNDFAWMISDYLEESPGAINRKVLEEADPDGSLPEQTVYAAVLSAFCGSTPETDPYFFRSVEKLDAEEFLSDPYLRTIRFPETSHGRWSFTHEEYAPYEAFICEDLEVLPDGTEIPKVGYFGESFRYPAVKEGGREWMAVKPSEIRSMKEPISAMHGDIAVIGLGLGYFPFMASLKNEVRRITLVDRDPSVMALFEKHLLPQFPFRDKITLVQQDAFSFLERIPEDKKPDCVFVDIWHDTSDGVPLYTKAKSLEKDGILYRYWLEKFLLSALRWRKAAGE